MFGNLSFQQIQRYADQFAVYLREHLGLMPGDRVALQMPNILAYPICAFGVFKAGCVLVNTNPLYTSSEMVHQFNDSGARVLVIVDLFADKLNDVLSRTNIEQVVVARVTDFFPALPGFIAYNVMKYWNRVIPKCRVPHASFRETLHTGARLLHERTIQVPDYTARKSLDDLAVLQYTGGTTGVSKGAMLSHGNLLSNMLQMDAVVRVRVDYGKECVLTVLPLYHVFAFTVSMLYFYYAGARNVLVPNPRPLSNVQRAVENYPISWIPGVNTLFNGLLNEEWFADYPPPQLRGSVAGGTALHAAVARRWEEVTGTPVIEGYGLTEASPVVCFNSLEEENRAGSIGKALPHTEIQLLDPDGRPVAEGEAGELTVRGPQVMQGYWQRSEETANVLDAGWLSTGDMATCDPDGYYRIVDRKKDLVLVSGFNVYPNEIEDCIAQLPQVQEVAVIGVPDAQTGEAVRAYIVTRPDTTLSAEDVRAHCKTFLTAYKVPRQVEFRDELPKSPVGKVLRRMLRDEDVPADQPEAFEEQEVGRG
jgi:long-chain acyl-CoA synthetase